MLNHQFILGDCLEELKHLPDGCADLVLADPPFGQDPKSKWDVIIPFEPLWRQLKRIVKANGVVVMMGQQPFTSKLILSNESWFRYEWIWDKYNPRGRHQAKRQPMRKHENILVFSKSHDHNYFPVVVPRKKSVKLRLASKSGAIAKELVYTHRNPTSIIENRWEANRGADKYHPAQKPVSLMEYLVCSYTQEGDTVLDFCFGGGSTGVACVTTNRAFIGIEKNKAFFEVGKARILTALESPTL